MITSYSRVIKRGQTVCSRALSHLFKTCGSRSETLSESVAGQAYRLGAVPVALRTRFAKAAFRVKSLRALETGSQGAA